MIGYGIVFTLGDEGFPFKALLDEESSPEKREEMASLLAVEEGEYYKYDEDGFYDLISSVTYTDKTPHVWVGGAGLIDTYYVILGSASQSISHGAPLAVDLDQLNPGVDREAFDGFVNRVFPDQVPTLYLIEDT